MPKEITLDDVSESVYRAMQRFNVDTLKREDIFRVWNLAVNNDASGVMKDVVEDMNRIANSS